jgi:hypothetical protein
VVAAGQSCWEAAEAGQTRKVQTVAMVPLRVMVVMKGEGVPGWTMVVVAAEVMRRSQMVVRSQVVVRNQVAQVAWGRSHQTGRPVQVQMWSQALRLGHRWLRSGRWRRVRGQRSGGVRSLHQGEMLPWLAGGHRALGGTGWR